MCPSMNQCPCCGRPIAGLLRRAATRRTHPERRWAIVHASEQPAVPCRVDTATAYALFGRTESAAALTLAAAAA